MNPHTPIDPHVAAVNGRKCLIRRARVAYNRKLTDADAAEIRRRWDAGESPSAIARMYDVSRQVIYRIGDRTHYRQERAA